MLLDTDATGTAMQRVHWTDDRGARDPLPTDAIGTRVRRKPMRSVLKPKYLPKKPPKVAAEARLLSILRTEHARLRKKVFLRLIWANLHAMRVVVMEVECFDPPLANRSIRHSL